MNANDRSRDLRPRPEVLAGAPAAFIIGDSTDKIIPSSVSETFSVSVAFWPKRLALSGWLTDHPWVALAERIPCGRATILSTGRPPRGNSNLIYISNLQRYSHFKEGQSKAPEALTFTHPGARSGQGLDGEIDRPPSGCPASRAGGPSESQDAPPQPQAPPTPPSDTMPHAPRAVRRKPEERLGWNQATDSTQSRWLGTCHSQVPTARLPTLIVSSHC
ncbi:uncharacterized protein LOC123592914 [Leopardus geoffroyi]|uniref:uncharacterized protein LOC123592914 n=1 Tax=Leopardus geoffroyi TaxID=46844 RepID=UPI001E25F3C0|nr:uncharacterized protein LOC123592914 [Leopardus geoffroyi]